MRRPLLAFLLVLAPAVSSAQPQRDALNPTGMVGGIFCFNYPGGTGLTSGAVFGRIAGHWAAQEALALDSRQRALG